jgi:hypothetical protein
MKTSVAIAAAGILVLTPALAAATQPAQPASDQSAAPAKDPGPAPVAPANATNGSAQQDAACATPKSDKSGKSDQSASSPHQFRDTGDTLAPAKKPKSDTTCATQPQ